MWPRPEIPEWARKAGCPQPQEGESFYDYVDRLGINFDEMVADLDARVPDMANQRLANALRLGAPSCYEGYKQFRNRV